MSRFSAAVTAAILVAAAPAEALDIQFDYTYDTGGFFTAHPERENLLEQVALVFESHLADVLTAIAPSGSNTWSATFPDPSTGNQVSVSNLSLATGVIKVYVGARTLTGSTLGIGGPGGFSASGSQAWLNTIGGRGQAGALTSTKTDFGPWGGAVVFDSDAPWYFGTGSLSGMDDFASVATHELGHLFGLGTAASWTTLVSGSKFTGPNATAANGGVQASLSGDLGHWAEGTQSKVFGTAIAQEAAMDPSLTVGTQKFFTNLDFAGMQDIGWQVVPEPSSMVLLGLAAGLLGLRRRQIRANAEVRCRQ